MGDGISTQIKLLVGIAKLNPCDDYVKKEGIKVAVENAIEDLYVVDALTIDKDKTIVAAVSCKRHSLVLSVSPDKGPRFIEFTEEKKGKCDGQCGKSCSN
jgi:hypothetical protein